MYQEWRAHLLHDAEFLEMSRLDFCTVYAIGQIFIISDGFLHSCFSCFTVCDLLSEYDGCFSVRCFSCFPTDQARKARKATRSFPDV